jgi:hypothetical protein
MTYAYRLKFDYLFNKNILRKGRVNPVVCGVHNLRPSENLLL